VRRYIAAIEAGDDAAIAELLRADAVVSHQPGAGSAAATTGWYGGRETIVEAWAPALHHPVPLALRLFEVWVNRQPAIASYARLPGTHAHRPFGLAVLRIDGGEVAEVVNLAADQFPNLGFPMTLPAGRAHTTSDHETEEDR
jgi:RNA polymerase sigma-70 factor (ECF subfamily)